MALSRIFTILALTSLVAVQTGCSRAKKEKADAPETEAVAADAQLEATPTPTPKPEKPAKEKKTARHEKLATVLVDLIPIDEAQGARLRDGGEEEIEYIKANLKPVITLDLTAKVREAGAKGPIEIALPERLAERLKDEPSTYLMAVVKKRIESDAQTLASVGVDVERACDGTTQSWTLPEALPVGIQQVRYDFLNHKLAREDGCIYKIGLTWAPAGEDPRDAAEARATVKLLYAQK